MEENITDKKLVRLKQKGQLTLPSQMRSELGLREGDLVEVTKTPDGSLLITPQEVIAMQALNKIRENLTARGITFNELMKSGREIRGKLVKEKYGLIDNVEEA